MTSLYRDLGHQMQKNAGGTFALLKENLSISRASLMPECRGRLSIKNAGRGDGDVLD